MWISPNYQEKDFVTPLSIVDKITIFEDRTLGWKLYIAEQVINGKTLPDGTEITAIPHSGFATLDILFSYFEMIAKYRSGFAQVGESKKYFIDGVYYVFPHLTQAQVPEMLPRSQINVPSLADYLLEKMYEYIRCGLYHSGFPNGPVGLFNQIPNAIMFDLKEEAIWINPHQIVVDLINHFKGYTSQLRDSSNQQLRSDFEARFDFDSRA